MPSVVLPSASRATGVSPSRSRAATPGDLATIPWLVRLDAEEHGRVVADLRQDPDWVHVRPPLVALNQEQSAALRARLPALTLTA